MRSAHAALLALLAAGCGGGATDPLDGPDAGLAADAAVDGDAGPPLEGALEVGTGTEDGAPGFVTLTPGGEVPLAPGAQGGFHVYVNLRVDGDARARLGEAPIVYREARRADTGQLVSRSRQRVELIASPTRPGHFESRSSMLMFLCPAPTGIAVFDQALDVRISASRTDDDPAPVVGETSLVPRCPETESRAFCLSICAG
jgi:hypothetical protein